MTSKLIAAMIRYRWWLLGIGLVLLVAAYPFSRRLEFDRSIENMFAPDDPLLAPYRKLKETFGGNEIVLAVYEDEQLLDASGVGIHRLEKIAAKLADAEGVQPHGVLSLAQVNETLHKLEFWKSASPPPILDPKSELATRYRELFAGYTHSHDGRTVAIAVMLEPQASTTVPRRETIDQLRAVMKELPDGLAPGMLAGEPVMLTDGFQYLEADGEHLGRTSLVLLALVIFLCFRSIRWVMIPIVVVQWSLIVTRALLAIAGFKLSMVSSMLTAIVTVVGIATVIHFIVHFRDELSHDDKSLLPPTDKIKSAFQRAGVLLLMPIVWSCLTDAVGFGSLMISRVGPVQDFGLMTAIGSVLVLPAVGLLVPGLALWGQVDSIPGRVYGEAALDKQLTRWIRWVEHHPRLLLIIFGVLTAISIIGGFLVEVETDFTRNFRRGSPVVQSYEFIETRLGGAGVWDVMLPAPQHLTETYLHKVRTLEDQLRAITIIDRRTGEKLPALTKVLSLADADEAAKASPALAALPPQLRSQGMAQTMPTFTAALRNAKPAADGRYYLRVMLRARERQGAADKKWLIGEVTRLSTEAFPPTTDGPGAEVTGFYVLLTHLIDSLLADQWTTFAIATAGIGLMMIVALRSLKLSLIALLPNALPISLAISSLGWLSASGLADLKMNMGAAMIAAVSMGLSIDSSVHYLLSYQQARRAGQSVIDALHAAQSGVGPAMVFSTLALLVGFSVLATSEFIPTVYFGVLVNLSMAGGLIGNLIVLPLFVRLTTRDGVPARAP